MFYNEVISVCNFVANSDFVCFIIHYKGNLSPTGKQSWVPELRLGCYWGEGKVAIEDTKLGHPPKKVCLSLL